MVIATMMCALLSAVVVAFTSWACVNADQVPPLSFGPSAVTARGVFPTSVYQHYFNDPTATSAQPQPVISDPVLHITYPLSLTDPDHIPQNDTADPHPLPPKASDSVLLSQAIRQIDSIITNPTFQKDSCAACHALLEVGKFLSLAAPEQGPAYFVAVCDALGTASDCLAEFGSFDLGSPITQVIANADVGGLDGQLFCNEFLDACPVAPATPLNLTAINWFAKPKPNPLPPPKKSSGKRAKVLHISDAHIDPRYANGAEAECTSEPGLCCRTNAFNTASPNVTVLPAPRYGWFLCDVPYDLMLAALQSIPVLAGTETTGFDWTIYTGDLVSHDPDNQLSRDYTLYAETVLYDLFKRVLGSGPVYPTLGNHDSYNEAQDAPHSLEAPLGHQFQWNYDHVAALWQHEQWLPQSAVDLARAHYAGYMVRRVDGLRIITLNTDFWYIENLFNYINLTTPDTSGMLRFLTDELQDAEDAGDRVWILGHVLSGWDGTQALVNPSDLFYQIVDRFSPHVIAGIFFGHSHEDEVSIFYANNATVINAENALAVSWVAPSVTPQTNGNSGFRVYEVDTGTFEVLDVHSWFADVSTFPALDNQTEFGPTFKFEYSTRETYGSNITWGPNDPLNATWWHLVTEQMEIDPSLVQQFTTFQGKSSIRTTACVDQCIPAKICYIRSGSAAIAFQNCIPGFGSVQGD